MYSVLHDGHVVFIPKNNRASIEIFLKTPMAPGEYIRHVVPRMLLQKDKVFLNLSEGVLKATCIYMLLVRQLMFRWSAMLGVLLVKQIERPCWNVAIQVKKG